MCGTEGWGSFRFLTLTAEVGGWRLDKSSGEPSLRERSQGEIEPQASGPSSVRVFDEWPSSAEATAGKRVLKPESRSLGIGIGTGPHRGEGKTLFPTLAEGRKNGALVGTRG